MKLDTIIRNLLLVKDGNLKLFCERLLYKFSKVKTSFVFFYARAFILKREIKESNFDNRLKELSMRMASFDDIRGLNKLFSNDEYADRFKRGDVCFIGENNGKIVGMEWLQFNKCCEKGIDCPVALSKDSVWLHDAYVEPSYRLKGVWVNLQNEIIRFCRDNCKTSAYTIVYSGNDISLRSHQRFGFVIDKELVFLRFLGFNFHLEKSRLNCGQVNKKFWFNYRIKRN